MDYVSEKVKGWLWAASYVFVVVVTMFLIWHGVSADAAKSSVIGTAYLFGPGGEVFARGECTQYKLYSDDGTIVTVTVDGVTYRMSTMYVVLEIED